MSRTLGILLICAIALVGAVLAYTALPKPRQAESEQVEREADRAGASLRSPDEKSADDERPHATALAESVRPNIVTSKRGQPLWALSHRELYEHVDDLRALADAGWGQAVLPLARLVSGCLRNPGPRSEQGIREQARSRRERLIGNAAGLPEDEVQRLIARVDKRVESQLQYSSRRRAACAAVMPADKDRIMDWLELALEQRHSAFLAGYLRWELLPDDDAWMVRYAERLARFNLGFLSALRARVMAGDREVVARAWKAFSGRRFMPEPDLMQAWTHGLVARRLPQPWSALAPTDEDFQRLVDAGLGNDELARAQSAADGLWRRCCAEARMPR